MSSKFAKQFHVPPEFPDILKDFAREVLRNQPLNINEFAAKYFDCLANGLPADLQDVGQATANDSGMSPVEVEQIIQDVFQKYDQDGNMYLDPNEFKNLMEDLQQRLEFPKEEILRFLAEADMNDDGVIQYQEFIPIAVQIIQSMYAKKQLQYEKARLEQKAEELLVHGMTREELTDVISYLFQRIDQDQSGVLSKQEFVAALTSMELGLTRKEINTIMFQIDQDKDGRISYREFVPFAFDLLHKLTELRLLESELQSDELALYLADLFKAKDTEMTGKLAVEDIRDLLHEAKLGLTKMQIYTVISEAEVTEDQQIFYSNFLPNCVSVVRSILSFEMSTRRDVGNIGPEAEERYFSVLDEATAGAEYMPAEEFWDLLQRCEVLEPSEMMAVRHLIVHFGPEVPVEEAKTQIWALAKSLRRLRGN